MMKNIAILLFGAIILFSNSCAKRECTNLYPTQMYVPKIITFADLRTDDYKMESPRQIENRGKIYYYQNYMFLNEINEGIHVIDMDLDGNFLDNIGFIPIQGNVDMAITCDQLYADSYSDIVALDIKNLDNISLLYREKNVFNMFRFSQNKDGIIYGYEVVDTIVEYDCDQGNYPYFALDEYNNDTTGGGLENGGTKAGGIQGSLARFTLSDGFLYTVDQSNLKIFDLENCSDLDYQGEINLGWGIETIYAFKSNLFIGSNTGMMIYGLNNPRNPNFRSEFDHLYACDPVFPTDDRAYVTLRKGTGCWNAPSQLDVLNIEDLDNPKHIKSYLMPDPTGLSVRNDILYLCQGDYGIDIYDVSDDNEIDNHKIGEIEDINAKDVIALGYNNKSILMAVGEGGFVVYDVTKPEAPKLLGKL